MQVQRRFMDFGLLLLLWGPLAAGSACGQEMEPRLYSNAPVGMNFLLASLGYSAGGLSVDPDELLQNAKLRIETPVFAYARILDIWGMSGKFDMVVPMAQLSGSADANGVQVTRKVSGLVDPAFRFSVNFIGAPALSLQEFRSYQQDLIVGASVQVFAPLGQYDPSKLVNLGTNRWTFRPEIGASKAIGAVTLELAQSVNLFTVNQDFFGNQTLQQNPVYATRANLIYNFGSGVSATLQAIYFTGGRTTLNGLQQDDLIQTSRAGATVSVDIDRYNTVKLFASKGLTIHTGTDLSIVGAAWQYRWGAGL